MNDLEVRQLRYFVAVAEELHFGRAAERLGMAQPPLSRAIGRLERRVGVRLLERTTRHVTLTPAGEVFLRDARIALDTIDAAVRRARHAGRPEPRLRLALKADHDAGLLPRILSAYHSEDIAPVVELVHGARGEQAPALRDGRADVALVSGPFDDRGLDHEPLLTEPRLVALAAGDPLAARPSLRLSDFAGRRLPSGALVEQSGLPSPHAGSGAGLDSDTGAGAGLGAGTGAVAAATVPGQDAARRERVTTSRQGALDITQIFELVELGSIVWFLPASIARRYPRPEIAYRAVEDLEPVTLSVAWPQEARSGAVACFVRKATEVAAAARSAPAS
ncbi:transcriptional regulator, LysR family [[Actinomadura] parvosata subsp. kistnae]|uniref:LysR family transcriptional regulator n=1 Tax=[Actinomadura] parvosata subsp. kistnae TaxID=1909395 RepID=A0A1U9ZU19_9ACTN|nr:LysR family transcriptional regulator [Nonomuraea sp. ATCC 55076]AQZ61446.1 LysR family transcriptional regulator [Nonomuraea sp. ATCC 55076]SPL98142.1 transcriptional regulator, LysR family [Actinomadura parvosata subsp. kistnae]